MRVLTTDVCLSFAYIGPKSRTERPILGRLKLTRTPLLRSKGQRSTCRGRGHIVVASRTACFWRLRYANFSNFCTECSCLYRFIMAEIVSFSEALTCFARVADPSRAFGIMTQTWRQTSIIFLFIDILFDGWRLSLSTVMSWCRTGANFGADHLTDPKTKNSSEWVSSCLTAHQHNTGYSVPLMVECWNGLY